MRRLARLIYLFLPLLRLWVFGPRPAREPMPGSVPFDPWKGISSDSKEEGHEVSEPKPKWVALSAAGLFFTIIIVMSILHWMKALLPNEPRSPVMTRYDDSFRHAPFAETAIARDWAEINRETYAHLHTYRWIDRKNGVAAIPIERAMQLVAGEGLLSRPGSPPAFPSPDQEMHPLRQSEQIHEVTKSY